MQRCRKLLVFALAFVLVFTTVISMQVDVAKAASKYYTVKSLALPTSFEEGTDFSAKGSVTSKYNISYIKVNVTENNEDKSVKGFIKESRPNKKSYSLTDAASSFNFSELKPGAYEFKVRVKDKENHISDLITNDFTVTKATFKISNESVPQKTHVGNPFLITGNITALEKMDVLYAGALDSKGNWVKGAYVKINPKSKTYNLNKQDSKISISKLPAGVYTYKIRVRDTKKRAETLVEEKFTVSKLEVKSPTKPTTIKEGRGFYVKGDVESKFTITNVKVGVQDKRGKWQPGVVAEADPNKTTYDIKKLDSKIKFGKLDPGSFDYKVIAEDKYGVERTLVDKSFRVIGASTTPDSDNSIITNGIGKKISYDVNNFYNIGKQPFSGPCGLYAMAYGRLVIDHHFGLNGYDSYYDRLHTEYGQGSNSAHWSEAGAGSYRTTSVKAVAQLALSEIQNGKPVILDLKSGYTGNQHFVLAIGYVKGTTHENVNSGSFIILDPASGTERLMAEYPLYQIDDGDMRIIRFW
ncbi:MAG: hypothetical protein RSA49_02270 [Anaerovoracaceae bacterium]